MPQPPRTLADVIAALSTAPSLPDRTRADLASAVRRFCKVLGADPSAVDARDLAGLQERIEAMSPLRDGLSPARWAVVRSQVLRALSVTRAAQPLRTAGTSLSPAWTELMSDLPKVRHRIALSRFGRFCTQQGVEPSAVTQEVFDRYGEALTSGSLVRNAHTVYRETALAWTQLPEGVLGRSTTPVEVPATGKVRTRVRHLLTSFPGSFRDDLDAFRGWGATADPLDDAARPKALRPQTIVSYGSALHTAADAAVRSGMPVAEMTSVAVLAEPDVYRRILRQMLADLGNTPSVHTAATVVLILARDWLRLPPERIAELKALKAKLPKLRPGLTQKNRELLTAFEDKTLLARFLELGDVLWKEAQSTSLPRNQRLVRAQMALLVGILQITPLRRKNICAVQFGRDITWPNGPNGPALIQVPIEEHKTEFDYVGELPLELSRRLHHYRTRLAPAITGSTPTHLFVRSDGRPKGQESVTNRLVFVMNKRLGLHMTAHQFRHLVGKIMLDDSPGAYEAVAQLLGHTGTKNVVKFYGGTDTRRASRHHAKLIEKLREEAKPRTKSRTKT